MKHIRVYGDSFAAKTLAEGLCWPELLAQQLDLPVIMNAVSGSSTEYAIKRLISDIDSINNDIVIFVTSTPGRLHFKHQHDNRPETAAQYLHSDPLSNGNDHKWYYQNKTHIEWWMVNCDNQLNQINHESYLHLLRSIARSKPDSIFIVLPNSDHRMHIDPGSNPPNFLITQTYLNRVSQNELVKEFPEYQDWIRYSKFDFRINHLSQPNLKILTSLVFDAIKSGDMSNITYDRFDTHFLSPVTSVDDYLRYVELGYLSHSLWAQSELIKHTS
jgi:hypothetical protein